MRIQAQVQERYQAALGQLVSRLEEDYYVLAAVLYGSLARGEPWERSDIDLYHYFSGWAGARDAPRVDCGGRYQYLGGCVIAQPVQARAGRDAARFHAAFDPLAVQAVV